MLGRQAKPHNASYQNSVASFFIKHSLIDIAVWLDSRVSKKLTLSVFISLILPGETMSYKRPILGAPYYANSMMSFLLQVLCRWVWYFVVHQKIHKPAILLLIIYPRTVILSWGNFASSVTFGSVRDNFGFHNSGHTYHWHLLDKSHGCC